jgi:hypothetical protein
MLENSEFYRSYYNQAQKSLVIQKKIKTIEFGMRSTHNISTQHPGSRTSVAVLWQVRSEASHSVELENSSLFWRIESDRFQIVSRITKSSRTDHWLVIRAFIASSTILPLQIRALALDEHYITVGDIEKRHIPDIAIAAKIGVTTERESNFYNSLPL